MPWKETARSFADARLSTKDEKETDSTQEQHKEEKARLESLSDRILRKFVRHTVKNRSLGTQARIA